MLCNLTASGKKAVAVSSGDGADAPVHSAKWQKGEKFMRGMEGVAHNAFGHGDASVMVGLVERPISCFEY